MSLRPRSWTKNYFPSAWGLLLDIIYPPRCGGCDRRGALFCDSCLDSLTPPRHDALTPPGIDLLICVGAFEGPLRAAIHNLKYGGDTPLARPLARFLWGAIEHDGRWPQFNASQAVIVPVPLHRDRQRNRGFNQSALLARELSRLIGWQIETGLLRAVNTRAQVGLNAEQRRENVREAFAWNGGPAPDPALLVDDVCTTGATLSECAAILRSVGTQRVYAATVGRAMGKTHDDSCSPAYPINKPCGS